MWVLFMLYRWHHNQSHFSNPTTSTISDSRSLRRSSAAYQNRGLYLLPPNPYQSNVNSPQLPLNPFSLSHVVSPTNVLSNSMLLQSESHSQNLHQSEVSFSFVYYFTLKN